MNVWEVQEIDDCNSIKKTKVIEGLWETISRKYCGDNYRINTVNIVPDSVICKVISQSDAENLTRNFIYDQHKTLIQYINEKIRLTCQKGENVLEIMDVVVDQPDKIIYFYTSLGYTITICQQYLRIIW